MNTLAQLVQHPFTQRIGEVLVHFLWQGSLVAGFLVVARRLFRHSGPRLRYAMSCAALALMTLAPLGTWAVLESQSSGRPGLNGSGVDAAGSAAAPTSDATAVTRIAIHDSRPGSWMSWLTLVWAAGVVGFSVRLAGGCWQAYRLCRRETRPAEPSGVARLVALQSRYGWRRTVRLVESAIAVSPLALGWLRPVIIVPVGMFASLPPAQVDALLAHELAHLRRGDFMVNLLQRVVETLLFYHPAVWWVSEQVRLERELCCDDEATALLGDGRPLAGALVGLAEREAAAASLALGADAGSVSDRVRRLLGMPAVAGATGSPRVWAWVALAVALMAIALWQWPRFTAPRLYVSTARLQLAPTAEGILSYGAVGQDPNWMETQLANLTSSTLLEEVIVQLRLRSRWVEPGKEEPSLEEVSARLRRHLAVRRFGNTSLIEVQAASDDPKEAAEIANKLVEDFLQQSQDRRLGKAMSGYRLLKTEAYSQEDEYTKALLNLHKYRVEKRTVSFSGDFNAVQASYRATQSDYDVARARSAEAQRVAEEAERWVHDGKNKEDLRQASTDQVIISLKIALNNRESELAQLLVDAADKNPRVVGLRQAIESDRKRLAAESQRIFDSIASEARMAKAKAEELAGELKQKEEAVSRFNELQINYDILQRKADRAKLMYEQILSRMKEFDLSSKDTLMNMTIIDKATPASRRTRWLDGPL